jgi:hypothetical protein
MRKITTAALLVLAGLVAAPGYGIADEPGAKVAVRKAPLVRKRTVVRHTEIRPVTSCGSVWRCTRSGCGWVSVCPRVCPDRYSCYPLYGAYGPYGGTGYWGAYTYSGWGYR